jgi:hypothetical protein
VATNAEILQKILGCPLLGGLTEDMVEFPSEWREPLRLGEPAQVSAH